mgnify:CR=1 FL=1
MCVCVCVCVCPRVGSRKGVQVLWQCDNRSLHWHCIGEGLYGHAVSFPCPLLASLAAVLNSLLVVPLAPCRRFPRSLPVPPPPPKQLQLVQGAAADLQQHSPSGFKPSRALV